MKPGKPMKRTRLKARAAKTKRSTIVHRQEVRAERTIHREETTGIYDVVAARADGVCECEFGCNDSAEQMDHFVTRRHGQSVEGCWMLSARHHLQKTENRPSRLEWAERFYRHCLIHGYEAKAAETLKTVEALRLKAALPL